MLQLKLLKTILYIIVGVACYWLVVRCLFKIYDNTTTDSNTILSAINNNNNNKLPKSQQDEDHSFYYGSSN